MISVRELLQLLGNDADEVARFLMCHDFRGVRGVGEDCPVAHYLKSNGIRDAAVDLTAVTYMQGDEILVEDLPEATENFVMLFDEGEYTDLVVARE